MTTLTLRDSGIVDNVISGAVAARNTVYSTDANLFIGAETTTNVNRALFKFPGLTPPGGTVVVSSATLELKNRDTEVATAPFEVRRMLAAWTASQTTWNNKATGTPWNVAGVLGGTDVDAAVIATGTSPTAGGTYFTLSGAGLIQYVQDVLNGATDYGIIISFVNDTSAFDGIARRQGASENSIATDRPVLTVVYTVVTPPSVSTEDVTTTSLSGTAVVVIELSEPAQLGGVNGTVNTADITAIAGVDYTAQTGVAFNIPEGQASGTITIPILPG